MIAVLDEVADELVVVEVEVVELEEVLGVEEVPDKSRVEFVVVVLVASLLVMFILISISDDDENDEGSTTTSTADGTRPLEAVGSIEIFHSVKGITRVSLGSTREKEQLVNDRIAVVCKEKAR